MSEDIAALVEQVRAGIRIHPDEPTDAMVALEVQADAALTTLVQRLGGEPDNAWEDMRAYNLRLEERAWAAEAEVKKLREKLNRTANYAESAAHIARGALAPTEETYPPEGGDDIDPHPGAGQPT